MNNKKIFFIAIVLLMIFSISAVSASNETADEGVNDQSGEIQPIINVADPPVEVYQANVSASNSTGNIAGYNASCVYGGGGNIGVNVAPAMQVSLKSSDDCGVAPSYVDLSVEYNDYVVEVNNKYNSFMVNQGFKDDLADVGTYKDFKLLNFAAGLKKNALLLNVNFLNQTNQEFKIESLFDSLLNALFSYFAGLI